MKLRFVLTAVVAAIALLAAAGSAFAGTGGSFGTHLSGDNEVPPRDTRAQGQAIFQLSEDGTSVYYKVIVANIENVVAGHIHIAPVGVNGPVVVSLVGPFPAGGGRVQGTVGEGWFTVADFVGPLAGAPMSDLLDAIAAGNAYVNVHTNDGVAPTNTGPGDFPGGEVRGQIEVHGQGSN